MSDISQILQQIESGDTSAADELLPLVYNELRKLASAKLAQEKPGQTLQATALVNEAYLRLVGSNDVVKWNGRGHFFGAAAQAMRRILVDRARQKASLKAGGNRQRLRFSAVDPEITGNSSDLVALDDALNQLERHDRRAFQVVQLRFFTGLTIPQAAQALLVSESTVEKDWYYAKAWLKQRLREND